MPYRVLVLLLLLTAPLFARGRPSSCRDCPTWNIPQQPFKIYGNTYYVGTRGLGAVLITSPAGDVLIDGALPESVPQIVAKIRSLGFRIEDITYPHAVDDFERSFSFLRSTPCDILITPHPGVSNGSAWSGAIPFPMP